MKKLINIFILTAFIYCIGHNYVYQGFVYAENQTIDVLLDNVDSKPSSIIIGELDYKYNKIELWHHSGKYWSYKGLQLNDELFGDELGNEIKLEEAINEQITFEIPLDKNLYDKLKGNKNIKIFCSSTLANQKTNKNIPITNLFYDKPIIEFSPEVSIDQIRSTCHLL
jgi:hypothetical protein